MSLITTVEATPSRVLGAYRYLVEYGPLPLEELAAQIWPLSTRSQGSKFHTSLRLEMLEAGLVEETDKGLSPHRNLPAEVRSNAASVQEHLPVVLADLVMAGPERNRDLAYAIAWYIGFDPRTAPGDDTAVVGQAAADGVAELIKVTANPTYGMFEDWVTYLGFGWVLPSLGVVKRTRLIPDPTLYVRRILPKLLPDTETPVTIGEFRNRLAELAPLFEDGALRTTVDGLAGRSLRPTMIASSTAIALLRLADEGILSLTAPSDAGVHTLPFGAPSRVSYITRLTPRTAQ